MEQKYTRGGLPVGAKPTGRAHPLGAPWWLGTTSQVPWPPSSAIRWVLTWKKIRRYFWDEAPPPRGGNLTRGPFALRQRDSIRETSLREGEIEAIVITNASSFMGGPIFIHIFTSTISSQTLVHLLYSIFISKPHISTCGLIVVLITSCSWCLLVYLVEDIMFRSLIIIITPMILNMVMVCE